METDPSAPAPLDMREADRLYQPFPELGSWKGLTEADLDLWDRFAKGLEAQRAAAPPEAFGRAVEVAMRAAAIDTGAIEGLYDVDRGFTMSVATQAVAWEHAVEEKGADVRALFEAQLEAYELVLDAATKSRPVYEAWVRQLHEVLCRAQTTYRVLTPSGWQEHELVKGQYKTLPNHVLLKDGSVHAYAPVDRVSQEMHRLVENLTSPEFEAAHPVLQATYAHYALVNVHPFADGNGRVARALASLYFYRAVSTPLVVFANQRPAYLDSLHIADTGDLEPFVLFFRDRGLDTMQLVVDNLLVAQSPSLTDAVTSLKRLHAKRSGFSHYDLDKVALRLLDEMAQEFQKQSAQLGLPEAISFHVSQVEILAEPAPTFRRISDKLNVALRIVVASMPPASATVGLTCRVLIARDILSFFSFRLEVNGINDPLDVRFEDVGPEISESFKMRLHWWVERQLSSLLKYLSAGASQSLSQLG